MRKNRFSRTDRLAFVYRSVRGRDSTCARERSESKAGYTRTRIDFGRTIRVRTTARRCSRIEPEAMDDLYASPVWRVCLVIDVREKAHSFLLESCRTNFYRPSKIDAYVTGLNSRATVNRRRPASFSATPFLHCRFSDLCRWAANKSQRNSILSSIQFYRTTLSFFAHDISTGTIGEFFFFFKPFKMKNESKATVS